MPFRRVESVICNVTLWCYVAKTQSGVAFLLLTLYGFCVQQGELGRVGGGASWRSGSLVLSPLLAAEMEK